MKETALWQCFMGRNKGAKKPTKGRGRERRKTKVVATLPPKVVIVPDKSRAIKQHNADKSFQGWRMYSDGSGRDGDVTAAATNLHWESGQRLGGVGIALTYHGELESLTTAAERLARISITDKECRGRTYKVYLDSQA